MSAALHQSSWSVPLLAEIYCCKALSCSSMLTDLTSFPSSITFAHSATFSPTARANRVQQSVSKLQTDSCHDLLTLQRKQRNLPEL